MSSSDAPAAGDGKVFISHSSRDRKMAQTISAALEHRGFHCWISSRDIGPGENFQEAIVRAIRQSRVMVLVFTGNANNSNEIKKEMALASQHNLAVIPVRVEDVVPNDAFAYEFATRQWIDTFDNWEHAIERLSGQLGMVLRGGSVADALAAGAPAASPAPPLPPPAPAAKSKAPWLAAAAALLVVIAGGGYFAMQRPSPSAPPTPQAAAPAPAAAPQPAAPPSQAAAPTPAAPQQTAAPAESDAPPTAPLGAANRAYNNGNYDRAFHLYQPLAEQGLPFAQFRLGFLYHEGLGTERNFAEAMSWYRKAADQGSSAAMFGVGQLYFLGQGVPKTPTEALRWYQAAADKGSPAGLVGIGNLYQTGQALPRDYVAAMRYYREAANKNAPNAGYFIGILYERGLGVPPDPQQARAWMQKAADLGSGDAKSWLALH